MGKMKKKRRERAGKRKQERELRCTSGQEGEQTGREGLLRTGIQADWRPSRPSSDHAAFLSKHAQAIYNMCWVLKTMLKIEQGHMNCLKFTFVRSCKILWKYSSV